MNRKTLALLALVGASALALTGCAEADVAGPSDTVSGTVYGVAYYEIDTPNGSVGCVVGRVHQGVAVDCNWDDVVGVESTP